MLFAHPRTPHTSQKGHRHKRPNVPKNRKLIYRKHKGSHKLAANRFRPEETHPHKIFTASTDTHQTTRRATKQPLGSHPQAPIRHQQHPLDIQNYPANTQKHTPGHKNLPQDTSKTPKCGTNLTKH